MSCRRQLLRQWLLTTEWLYPHRAEVDIELAKVFEDVGTLPAMVTPVCDPAGGLVVTLAEYPGPAIPNVSVMVMQPLVMQTRLGLQSGILFVRNHRQVGELFVGTSDDPGGAHAGNEPVVPGCCNGPGSAVVRLVLRV